MTIFQDCTLCLCKRQLFFADFTRARDPLLVISVEPTAEFLDDRRRFER